MLFPAVPPDEEIAHAFTKAVMASPLKKRVEGQLTITFKDGQLKLAEGSGTITLTHSQDRRYVERLRVRLSAEQEAQLTITDVLSRCTSTKILPLFSFKPPLGARNVKELPSLLPQ